MSPIVGSAFDDGQSPRLGFFLDAQPLLRSPPRPCCCWTPLSCGAGWVMVDEEDADDERDEDEFVRNALFRAFTNLEYSPAPMASRLP